MEEELWKRWEFLQRYSDALITRAAAGLTESMRNSIVLTGGTSLHLYSARILFRDQPIRASEDIDFFNENTRVIENPDGIEEEEIAEQYAKAVNRQGFETERHGRITLVKPHRIKVEFFYDSRSLPEKTYLQGGLRIIHPESLYRIKIRLLLERETLQVRDLIDALYLSTKYGLPYRIQVREKIDDLIERKNIENYLTEYGESYFRSKNYDTITKEFLRKVDVHDKD